MRKFQRAFLAIAEVRAIVRGDQTRLIKKSLGDSTRNNRTLTVNQMIRFLLLNGNTKLARLLLDTSKVLEKDIITTRGKRTDAVDLGELVNVYRNVVMTGKNHRKVMGKILTNVERING